VSGTPVQLIALVPEQLAYVATAQPVLAWYLSRDLPAGATIDLVVNDEDSFETLVEHTLTGPFTAGTHRSDLAALGVRLDAGATYSWSVALPLDPSQRSQDIVSGGMFKVVPIPEPQGDAAAQAGIYAQHGYWYDALAVLTGGTGDGGAGADGTLQALRAALLSGAGLSDTLIP